jgi:hypothetical protein
MPVIVPPALSSLPQGHRITAHYQFSGDDVVQNRVPILGGSTFDPIFYYEISMLKIQGTANIPPIKTVQFSYVGYPHTANETFPMVGVLWVVVDRQQVFTFEIPQNPPAAIGFFPACFNAMFPVVANNQSTVGFGLFLSNYPVGSVNQATIGDLYVTLADFDAGTFHYPSQGIIPAAGVASTIPNPLPVDVVNTSMNVFVNNPDTLPVPVTNVP